MTWILLLAISSSVVSGVNKQYVRSDHCRSANAWSDNSVANLQRIVTGMGAGSIKLRAAYKLPYVTSTPAVVLVASDSVCAAAAAAVEQLYTNSVSPRPVWVFRIGSTHYAVSDAPNVIHIFDNNFTWLATLSEVS